MEKQPTAQLLGKKSKFNYDLIIGISLGIIIIIVLGVIFYFQNFNYKIETNKQAQLIQTQEEQLQLIATKLAECLDSEKTIAVEPEENLFKLDDKFRAFFLANDDSDNAEIQTMDENFQLHDIYDFDATDYSYAYLSKTDNQIIIARRYSKFNIINYNGTDVTERFVFLDDLDDYSRYILHPDLPIMIYTKGVMSSQEIIIYNYKTDESQTITSDLLPDLPESVSPVGWSSDYQYVYLTKIGWEGFTYADLWKMNFETHEITKIKNADKVALNLMDVNPSQDLAVGVATDMRECSYGCMGNVESGPPESIYLFDLKNNTSKVIYHTDDKLIENIYLSPDGQQIFFRLVESDFSNFELDVMDLDSLEEKTITENAYIEGMSYDGSKLIIQDPVLNSRRFRIYDQATNEFTDMDIIQETEISDKFLDCFYPLGFSCLYE